MSNSGTDFPARWNRTPVGSSAAIERARPILRGVQGLRGIAALLVVLMHMQLPHNGVDVFAHPVLGIFRYIGHFGVDLFFAISGFIMIATNWGSFGKPNVSVPFLVHRAIRIYPAYWLSILPIFLAYVFARDRLMPGHSSGKTDFLASILLYPQPVDHVLLPVSWTLVFELSFYLVFAALLRMRRTYVVPALGVWLAIQLGLWFAFDGSSNAYLKYAATALPMEFIFGALVGVVYARGRMPGAKAALMLGIAGAGAVWAASNGMDHLVFTSSLGRVVCFGIPAALIVYGSVALDVRGLLRTPLWLVALGDASYSLYLWHFPLLSALRQAVLHFHLTGLLAEVVVVVSSLAVEIGVSIAVYRVFERPVTKALGAMAAGRMSVRRLAWSLSSAPSAVTIVEE